MTKRALHEAGRREEDLALPCVGERVAGRYRVVGMLGRGGCGVVYEARDEHLDRAVALKVLSPRAAARIASLRPRFAREIELIGHLEHPNIVRLYDFGEPSAASPHFWMAMELVRGEELTEATDASGRMAPSRVRHIMLQLLSGLTAVHRAGIVHRDLKPNNIMLSVVGADRDVVKLLDFGVGKLLGGVGCGEDITAPDDALLGTPRYMAPEVLLKQRVGPWSDVYAAGLVMLELLSGEHAITGDEVCEVIAQQLSGPVEPPAWLADSALGQVLRRATAKAWPERYSSAREFHEALRRVPIPPALEAAFDAAQRPTARRSDAPRRAAATGPQPLDTAPPLSPHDTTQRSPAQRPARRAEPSPLLLALAASVAVALMTATMIWLPGGAAEPPLRASAMSPAVASVRDAPPGLEIWTFDSEPAGARVEIAGELACVVTPCQVTLSRALMPLELRFERSGYEPTTRVLDGDEAERVLEVELQPASNTRQADLMDYIVRPLPVTPGSRPGLGP